MGDPRASRASALPRLLDRALRRSETPVVLCIDVEPDPRAFDPADPPAWLGFECFVERMPALRARIEDASGAPAAFTWFLRMDPQVAETWDSAGWVAETYPDALAGLLASGDELALHTHPWRWEPGEGEWIVDYADPAWGERCLTTGLDAFESSFGRACSSHRGGDRFLSGALLPLLEARGIRVDLTVEPGRPPGGAPAGESARGRCPDYRGVPTGPYRSSPDSFPAADAAGRAGPLLVPLLSGAPGPRPPFRRWPISLESPSWVFTQRLAWELASGRPPVLAFAVRSDAALGWRWDAMAASLDHLSRHARMPFLTATSAAERFAA